MIELLTGLLHEVSCFINLNYSAKQIIKINFSIFDVLFSTWHPFRKNKHMEHIADFSIIFRLSMRNPNKLFRANKRYEACAFL